MKHCITAHTLDFDYILHFLSSYTCEQRLILVRDLEYEYNYRLIDMVLERPESPMRLCTLAMLIEPIELYARDFHEILVIKRTHQVNVDLSRHCVEILLTLMNNETEKFRDVYQQLFGSAIETDIENVYGHESIVSKLFVQLLQGKRNSDADYSATLAKSIARKLYEAGEGTPGIDYDTFISIFTSDGFAQLSAIFDVYEDKYDRPIQEAIEREFQGQRESTCFQDIVDYTRSPSIYYAKILQQAFNETPIDYRTLIRVFIGHDEKDLCEIRLEYSKLFEQTLDQTIHQRVDMTEIKRLFIMIINHGHDLTSNDNKTVHFDHENNSSSDSDVIAAGTTANSLGMRRNRSHDAVDRIFHALKSFRPH
jgi:annexin D